MLWVWEYENENITFNLDRLGDTVQKKCLQRFPDAFPLMTMNNYLITLHQPPGPCDFFFRTREKCNLTWIF